MRASNWMSRAIPMRLALLISAPTARQATALMLWQSRRS